MFRFQRFRSYCLTPDTRNPEVWCLEFDILQYSTTPSLQPTHAKENDHGSPLWGRRSRPGPQRQDFFMNWFGSIPEFQNPKSAFRNRE